MTMDELELRRLLDQLAHEGGSPCTVDVALARGAGRRRLRLRRAAMTGASAIATAVAALVAGGALPLGPGGSHRGRPAENQTSHHGASRPTWLPVAPARLNPLDSYASYGWLPKGFARPSYDDSGSFTLPTIEDIKPDITSGTDTFAQGPIVAWDMATLRELAVQVTARGDCRLTGPFTMRADKFHPPGRAYLPAQQGSKIGQMRFPHGLKCETD